MIIIILILNNSTVKWYISVSKICFKWIVHRKMDILSSFTHSDVVSNQYDCFFCFHSLIILSSSEILHAGTESRCWIILKDFVMWNDSLKRPNIKETVVYQSHIIFSHKTSCIYFGLFLAGYSMASKDLECSAWIMAQFFQILGSFWSLTASVSHSL